MNLHSLGGSGALGGCFAPLPFGAIVVSSRSVRGKALSGLV